MAMNAFGLSLQVVNDYAPMRLLKPRLRAPVPTLNVVVETAALFARGTRAAAPT